MKFSGSIVDITPVDFLPLAGYGSSTGPAKGIFSRLEANVLVFEGEDRNVALIGVDTLFVGTSLKDAITGHLRLEGDGRCEIHLLATHTHFAPSLDPSKPRLGIMSPAYMQYCSSRIADGLKRAILNLNDGVSMVRGSQICEGSVYRRDYAWTVNLEKPFLRWGMNLMPNHREPISKDLTVYFARYRSTSPAFVLWSWPCHPVMSPRQDLVSADFPGIVRDAIRRHVGSPEMPVVYAPGFCGDIRPNVTTRSILSKHFVRKPFRERFAPVSAERFRSITEEISSAAKRALASARSVITDSCMKVNSTNLPLSEISSFENDKNICFTMMSSGNFGIFGVGAEVCKAYVSEFFRFIPSDFVLTGYFGDVFGYLPPDSHLADGGYEADSFAQVFSLSGSFNKAIEKAVCSRAAKAVI